MLKIRWEVYNPSQKAKITRIFEFLKRRSFIVDVDKIYGFDFKISKDSKIFMVRIVSGKSLEAGPHQEDRKTAALLAEKGIISLFISDLESLLISLSQFGCFPIEEARVRLKERRERLNYNPQRGVNPFTVPSKKKGKLRFIK